jgi:glutaminyl-peptide cyclotransferase
MFCRKKNCFPEIRIYIFVLFLKNVPFIITYMKSILQPFIILLMLFLAFQCCTSKTQRSRKPVSTVAFSPASKSYVAGQSLNLNISTKVHDGEIKDVSVYLNNELLTSSDQLEFSHQINNVNYLGQNSIRIVAEKKDGVSNTRLYNFDVLSDIVPQKYSYEIIRDYPHNTEHFTQGLEFHETYLYEGTGEYGKSGIFKTDHVNGRTLLSKKLDDQYFGEGITILNEKLYQLTYKSQIGFVYNLTDFSVIDSFRFESKEGWGLTNDGKSLIMSDGTGTLTWLNPGNYSIEKKINIADNQRTWQYINELEYVNGSIWANVWTTNQIIRIDSENGKILGYADLEGILSIMHQSHLARIDVLNGIAYNPQNGNFYVTGKLWPKIFEIKIVY